MKIGLLVIATNKYIQFVEPLFTSAQQHFLVNHEVTMFVFTNMALPQRPGIHKIFLDHLGWPGATLMRYHVFSQHAHELADQDYLFYCDADMRFVAPVGDEILGDLVGTIHPGFYEKPRSMYTYETRPESLAYIPDDQGTRYYAGGFNGGKRERFLGLADTVVRMIDEDLSHGVVAVWHDESFLNRYFLSNPPTVALPPSYCYPESWQLPFEKKLLALDKNHAEMRG